MEYISKSFADDIAIKAYCGDNDNDECACVNRKGVVFDDISHHQSIYCITPACRREKTFKTKEIQEKLKGCNAVNCTLTIDRLRIDNSTPDVQISNHCSASQQEIISDNHIFFQRPLLYDYIPATWLMDYIYVVLGVFFLGLMCMFIYTPSDPYSEMQR